ncbi:MAG: zinc ribbon domain-containing protein [Oscillospiraceae bacterium]|nr:zinc ribbon domain-containing protein [Oscillospiraceae bacterium]
MICPKCGYDNKDTSKFCTHCGDPLLLSDKSPADAFTANQVWNMEIEQEQNKSNSRTALIVLAVAVVLIVGLVAAALFLLPEFGFGNGDWDDGHVEYDLTMCNITGTADDEFRTDFPALVTFTYNNCYDLQWAVIQERELLEPYRTAAFDDPALQGLVEDYFTALDDMYNAQHEEDGMLLIDDNSAWYTAYCEMCLTVGMLQAQYDIFPKDDIYIPVYYSADGMSRYAELLAEIEFADALTGLLPTWDARERAYTVTLTNHGEYIADLIVYNDYETEDDWLYEEDEIIVYPGETVTIVLEEMPDEYENWYADVYVMELYMEDELPLYDYYWERFYDEFSK